MKAPRTECDCCGRSIAKAKRILNGDAYCDACYSREFYVVPCVDCGANARVLGRIGYGRCRTCVRKTRHCVRCSGFVLHAALIVNDGAVCRRCRRFFEPYPKQPPKVMGNRTCAGCHKYRPVAFRDERERPFCEACREPAHIKEAREKNRLYWAERIRTAARVSSQGLEGAEWQVIFRDMILTYGESGNVVPLLKRVPTYLKFVQELEQLASNPIHLRASAVLEKMTARELRKHERVVTFLHSRGVDVPTRAAADAASDQRRVQEALAEVDGSRHRQSIEKFSISQSQPEPDGRRRTPATIRLNVRAAVELVTFLGERAITIRGIEQFLASSPGHRSALYAFVTFLRAEHPTLKIPPKANKLVIKTPATVAPLILDRFKSAEDFSDARAGFMGVLMAFVGTPLSALCVLPFSSLATPRQDQYVLTLGKQAVTLPSSVVDAIERYLDLRSAFLNGTLSPYLFPGRPGYQPITAAAIGVRLRSWGIKPGDAALSARRAVVAAVEERS